MKLNPIVQVEMTEMAVKAYRDPQAFAAIYEVYFPRVYNYVRYRVRNPETTDDLTSLIFEKVLKNIRLFRPEQGTFSAWLFTIAHNVVSDHFRNGEKCRWTSLDAYHEISASTDTVEEVVEGNELRTNLLKALAELNERERNIIALKFWSGLTNRRIADLIGLSESNIGVIIYRAMRRLNAILKYGGEESL